ncbi:MAG: CBS domain-containing protein [Clostridiales bacterium]|nr:CBS domain-containing protein [Clostridiales bacterium]
MNILFFLTPKNEVAYIYNDFTMRQAIEKVKHYGYTAIPMIDRDGRYIGTVTEGDLLWYLLEHKDEEPNLESIRIGEIDRRTTHCAVNAEMNIESLVKLIMNQNFVPVVDDRERFIGIITRKAIVQYCAKHVIDLEKV